MSKQAPKKGLAGLFAALVGQALSGQKAASGTAKATKSLPEALEAKEPLDKKKIAIPAKPPQDKDAHSVADALVADGKLAASGQGLKSPQVKGPAARRGGGPEASSDSESPDGGEELHAASRRKRLASDRPEAAAAQGGLLQPALTQSQETKQVNQVAQAKTEARGLDNEGSKKKSLDDPGLSARIHIVDQRKAGIKVTQKPETEAVATESVAANSRAKHGEDSRSDRDLLVDLSKSAPTPTADKGSPASEAAAKGQNFAALLADRLRDSGNTEIVQSARIILKDGDSGSIRMRLNPPELGNVKIELHLADNNISGKIIVESDAARSAFEKGLSSLQDAFRSGGFESAKLEVQVGSGNAQGQGAWNGGGRGAESPPGPFWSERSRSLAFEPSSAGMATRPARQGRAVDIVV